MNKDMKKAIREELRKAYINFFRYGSYGYEDGLLQGEKVIARIVGISDAELQEMEKEVRMAYVAFTGNGAEESEEEEEVEE